MRVGIIDADLIGRNRHRFPNLASMKISGYHKAKGDEVTLITEYLQYSQAGQNARVYKQLYDKIYVSKVFVDTSIPYEVLNLDIAVYGGTGFFYSDAEPLPCEIEHHMPDYHLYDELIEQEKIRKGDKFNPSEFKYYTDFSVGFTTRGCIRHCQFCVNKHCNKVNKASCVNEFLDESRPWICLLDDNILAYENWREVLDELDTTGKFYEFKQGLDIRGLNETKTKRLMASNLKINNLYFAFDNIDDRKVIEEKLKLWRKYYGKNTNMYVLCGFDREGKYNEQFWNKDVRDTLERIKICIKYGVHPYIMRYRMYKFAPITYKGMYVNLASWCNQKTMFTKYTLNEWANYMQELTEEKFQSKKLYSTKRYLVEYEDIYPKVAEKYFNLNLIKDREFDYEKGLRQYKPIVKKNKKPIVTDTKDKTKEKINADSVIKTLIPMFKNMNNTNNRTISEINASIKKKQKSNYSRPKNLVFNMKNLTMIIDEKPKTIFINCKNDTLPKDEMALIYFLNLYLKNDVGLYIFNNNVKTFENTRMFIEKNTNFKFSQVTMTHMIYFNQKFTTYCARYVLGEERNRVFKDIEYDKSELIKMIANTGNKDDKIAVFFENSLLFKDIEKKHYCLIKKGIQKNARVLKLMNQAIDKAIEEKSNEQLSFIKDKDSEENIG